MSRCWVSLSCGFAMSCFGSCLPRRRSKRCAQQPANDATQFYGPRVFTYKELTAATKDFSAEEILGRGAFGNVYKGTLGDSGSLVAVKQISKDSHQGEREFLAEVSIISRIRHRNLVQLQGWCHEKGKLLLVYDYMPKGSLDNLLVKEGSGKDSQVLAWHIRHNILSGVAAALACLHEEWAQCILHRDVKPSNVLLDENFNPHLADFGLARLIDHSIEMVQTSIIAGTRGYLSPELLQTGKASTKSDVFSFGVLALEVACGRRPVIRSLPENQVLLTDCVWRAHEKNNLLSAVDPKLGSSFDAKQMMSVLQIALFCCHPDPEARPPMSFVRNLLTGDSISLPPLPPTKPVVTYSLQPAVPTPDSVNSEGAVKPSSDIQTNTQSQSKLENLTTKSSSEDLTQSLP